MVVEFASKTDALCLGFSQVTAFDNFSCRIQNIHAHRRSETVSIFGKLNLFDDDATSAMRPAAAVGNVVEALRGVGPEEAVLRFVLSFVRLSPHAISGWHGRCRIMIRRFRHGAALIEDVHELEIIHFCQNTVAELDLAVPCADQFVTGIFPAIF